MSTPTCVPSRVARMLTIDTPAYHFAIPVDITSIGIHTIPANTIVYISADKRTDIDYNQFAAWNPEYGIADVSYFNEYGEEFIGYINFDLMWQNSVYLDD